jgi:hypothetical protein
LSRNYVRDADVKIDILTKELGYLEREAEDLDRKERQARQIQILTEAKERLIGEITTLKDEIARLKKEGDRRRSVAFSLVSRKTAEVLALDLPSEDEFTINSSVSFEFGDDRVTVNGKAGYSASSLVVVRNAFHLALLWASTLDPQFMYPRFLLMDNIEDKGMNQARSQNFQRRIVEISKSLDGDHQIIFTTSMIDPGLESSALVVGEHYTYQHKSLNIAKRA